MRLRKIAPINYRGFSTGQELELTDTVTVLAGANDSGKSTLLDLIKAAIEQTSANYTDVHQTALIDNEQSSWEQMRDLGAELVLEVIPDESVKTNQQALRSGCIVSISADLAPKITRHRVTNVTGPGRKSNQTAPKLHGGLPEIVRVQMRSIPKSDFELTEPINQNVVFGAFYRAAFGRRRKPDSFELQDRELHELVRRSNKKLQRALKQFGLLDAGYSVSFVHRGGKAVSVEMSGHQGLSLPPRRRGQGAQRLFQIVSQLMDVQHGKSVILLLDEPETSLHPSAQRQLRRMLEAMAEKSHVQVVYSTHSPAMLNPWWPNSLRVIRREGRGDNAVSVIDNRPFEEDFFNVRECLGISPIDSLVIAPVVIGMEGKTERACLGMFLRKLANSAVGGFDAETMRQFEFATTSMEVAEIGYAHANRIITGLGGRMLLFLDGDERESVESNNDLEGIPRVFAGDANTEFENLIPKKYYFSALQVLHDDDTLTEDALNAWLEDKEPLKQKQFSKRVKHWLQSEGYRLKKDRTMDLALKQCPASDIEAAPFRTLLSMAIRLAKEQ